MADPPLSLSAAAVGDLAAAGSMVTKQVAEYKLNEGGFGSKLQYTGEIPMAPRRNSAHSGGALADASKGAATFSNLDNNIQRPCDAINTLLSPLPGDEARYYHGMMIDNNAACNNTPQPADEAQYYAQLLHHAAINKTPFQMLHRHASGCPTDERRHDTAAAAVANAHHNDRTGRAWSLSSSTLPTLFSSSCFATEPATLSTTSPPVHASPPQPRILHGVEMSPAWSSSSSPPSSAPIWDKQHTLTSHTTQTTPASLPTTLHLPRHASVAAAMVVSALKLPQMVGLDPGAGMEEDHNDGAAATTMMTMMHHLSLTTPTKTLPSDVMSSPTLSMLLDVTPPPPQPAATTNLVASEDQMYHGGSLGHSITVNDVSNDETALSRQLRFVRDDDDDDNCITPPTHRSATNNNGRTDNGDVFHADLTYSPSPASKSVAAAAELIMALQQDDARAVVPLLSEPLAKFNNNSDSTTTTTTSGPFDKENDCQNRPSPTLHGACSRVQDGGGE